MGLTRSLFAPLTSRLMPWREYYQRVLNVRPDKLVGYWPMWEPSGATSYDLSKQGNNGAYTAVTLAQRGMGDGRTATSFNGTTSKNNIYSAAFAADLNGNEGTAVVWGRITAPSVWADGANRELLGLVTSAGDNILLNKSSVANSLRWGRVGGAGSKAIVVSVGALANFFCVAMTWSVAAGQLKAYLQGVQVGTTQTGLLAWTGSLQTTTALWGAISTTPSNVWSGVLAHGALWSTPLPADAIAYLGRYDPLQGT